MKNADFQKIFYSASAIVMEILIDNETTQYNGSTYPVEDFLVTFLPTVVIVPPLGLPTNALVICFLLGKPGICSTSEIFTLNLALFDMLFCCIVPVEYILLTYNPSFTTASFLVWGLNQAGGPMLLCMLSLDSYIAVCHPLVYRRLKDPKLRLSVCLVVSAITATCCGLVKISSRSKWNVISALLCTAVVTISTCNILILKSLSQSGPNKKEVHPVKKRAFKLVLTAFALVIIHYIPPVIQHILLELFSTSFKPFSLLGCVVYLILSMGSFFQPLSYLIRTKQLPKMSRCCSSGAKTEIVVAV